MLDFENEKFFPNFSYPDYTPILIRAVELWAHDPAVTTPVLKLFSELVQNRSQRLQFEVSSPNGILLFREASKIICCYGTLRCCRKIWTFHVPIPSLPCCYTTSDERSSFRYFCVCALWCGARIILMCISVSLHRLGASNILILTTKSWLKFTVDLTPQRSKTRTVVVCSVAIWHTDFPRSEKDFFSRTYLRQSSNIF